MALWDLILVGIESRMRGVINWMVRKGRSILDRTLARDAADHMMQVMSVREQEDRQHIYRIAQEQQDVIRVSQQIQRGQIVGNEREVPKVSTFTGPEGSKFRYVVVVKMRDSVTGAVRETVHEFYQDVPVIASDIKQFAISQSMQQQGNDTITGSIGIDRNWGEVRATIVSVTQRM